MKKLLLLSAILLGAATASQAGVRINLGFGLPLPVPPVVVAPAPVYQAPVYQAPYPVYDYSPSIVVAPPVPYFGFGYRSGYHYPYRHYYYSPRYYGHYHHRRW